MMLGRTMLSPVGTKRFFRGEVVVKLRGIFRCYGFFEVGFNQ